MNMFCQFLRLTAYLLLGLVVLIFIPILLVPILLVFVVLNASYALRREKLPCEITNVVTKSIFRGRSTCFILYLGWFFQNWIFRRFIKALKKKRSTYNDAKSLLKKIRELISDIKKFRETELDVGDEFNPMPYEKFSKRDYLFSLFLTTFATSYIIFS